MALTPMHSWILEFLDSSVLKGRLNSVRFSLEIGTMGQSRREFLTAAPAGLWAAATIAGSSNTKNDPRAGGGFKGSVCFFSKHLPDTTWRELARRVKRMGFEGVDLTVRTGGHVVPEKGA